jgi:hypothetical protein
MPKYVSNSVLVPGVVGDPCPRCGQPMRIFQHAEISDRQKRAPFFYRRWHRCLSDSCKTTVVMRDEDRIWNIDGEDRTNLEEWLTKHTAAKAKAS